MRIFFIAFVALAVSCKTNHKEVCDSDFDTFFKRFARDSIFQKNHVDFPVMEYSSDEDFPLDLMESNISKEEYTFTDFTDDKNLYDISVEKKKDTVTYVRTWRESYGVMTYKFACQNNCWNLVEIQDITD